MQNEAKPDRESNPYYDYCNLFCKVILKSYREGRPLKGVVTIISKDILRIRGDFLDTMVNVSDVSMITTKLANPGKLTGEQDKQEGAQQ